MLWVRQFWRSSFSLTVGVWSAGQHAFVPLPVAMLASTSAGAYCVYAYVVTRDLRTLLGASVSGDDAAAPSGNAQGALALTPVPIRATPLNDSSIRPADAE